MTAGSPVTSGVRAAAAEVAGAALRYVQDPQRGVRVEDYLAALGAVTGEAAFVDAGFLDIEHSDIAPGSAVFGDAANQVLSGDSASVADAPAGSVLGVLVAELVPEVVPLDAFAVEDLYRHVAASVGSAAWGTVVIRAPADNQPVILPIRAAFELRQVVEAVVASNEVDAGLRHVVCAVALADALRQVRDAIDIRIGVAIALDVVWGMAKMMPMSQRAMAEAAAASPPTSAGD